MSSYGSNMAPTSVSGAYQGPMGMGQPNANMSPNANFPPSPAYTSPTTYAPPMPNLHPMHCGPINPPMYTAAVSMNRSSTGVILVLFILLVIILRAFPRY